MPMARTAAHGQAEVDWLVVPDSAIMRAHQNTLPKEAQETRTLTLQRRADQQNPSAL